MLTVALAVALVMTALTVTAPGAYATWSVGSGASGYASARAIALPTNASASVLAPTAIRVSWSAPSGSSVAPAQYVVRRTAPTSVTVCTVATSTFTCDDTGLSASTTYRYTVEARVGTNWSSGQTGIVSATTPTPTFVVAPAAGTRTAGASFTVTLTATTDGTTVDTAYTGSHAVTFSGPANSPNGTAPSYPASVVFSAGVGAATITLVAAESPTVTASDGTRSGSAGVTVVAATGIALSYTSSNVSCASGTVHVGNGGSFISKVSQVDAYGNPVGVTVATAVSIGRSTVVGTLSPTSLTIPVPAAESSAAFTFKLPSGSPPSVTITASFAGLASAACIVLK